MPFAWLMRHPPDPTLVTLLIGLGLVVLFFEPMYRFAAKLQRVGVGTALVEAEPEPHANPDPPAEGPTD